MNLWSEERGTKYRALIENPEEIKRNHVFTLYVEINVRWSGSVNEY